VQHVIEYVPGASWAKDSLHQAFQEQYVSLSRQKAGSHVVQRCLQFFSRKQADEIVSELLNCKRQCDFGELISDPFANYVLQTAMERTEVRILPLFRRPGLLLHQQVDLIMTCLLSFCREECTRNFYVLSICTDTSSGRTGSPNRFSRSFTSSWHIDIWLIYAWVVTCSSSFVCISSTACFVTSA
jgi:hypothetical protein